MMNIFAPFGVTRRIEKIGYCNRNIIPRLIAMEIEWKMTDLKISFGGRVFPMKYIDNGEAEAFLDSLICEGQSKLDMWK